MLAERFLYLHGEVIGEVHRNSIPYHLVAIIQVFVYELIIVGEGLQSGNLSDAKSSV